MCASVAASSAESWRRPASPPVASIEVLPKGTDDEEEVVDAEDEDAAAGVTAEGGAFGFNHPLACVSSSASMEWSGRDDNARHATRASVEVSQTAGAGGRVATAGEVG